MGVVVVDSGGANISSVLHALRRLGADPVFTGEGATIRAAERVILPGVGSAGAAMEKLRENGLDELLPGLEQPVLGICLGMQLLFRHSAEDDVPLLGIVDADLRRLPNAPGLHVPHMGWNQVNAEREDPVMKGLDGAWFYFVHSYAAPVGDWTVGRCRHGLNFTAVVREANFAGAQFHPERSASSGARLLRNFLEST